MAMRRRFANNAGFSLIELMVATSVLILMLSLLLQMFNGVSRVTARVGERIGINKATGAFFDRLNFDWRAMPHTGGNHPVFEQNVDGSPNDRLRFYSQVNGPGSASRLSLCQWEVYSGNDASEKSLFHALRTVQPVDWASTSTVDPANPPEIVNKTAQPIGDGIFRMELSLVLEDGSIFNDFKTISVDSLGRLTVVNPSGTTGVRVRALLVSLAVIDGKTTGHLTPEQVINIRAALLDPGKSQRPLEVWQSQFDTTPVDKIPAFARQGVRFDERFYYFD